MSNCTSVLHRKILWHSLAEKRPRRRVRVIFLPENELEHQGKGGQWNGYLRDCLCYVVFATIPPWWFSETAWPHQTETRFIVPFVLMSQTVTLLAGEHTRLCQIPCESKSRMMISTQTISVCAPRIPQLGICINSSVSLSPVRRRGGLKWSSCFQKGRGCSTLAMKQESSSAEDAPADVKVPAKDTGLRDSTGIKIVELVDPISLAKPASTVDDDLPPLLSMVIDGLPPLEQSEFVHDAENYLQQYVERYQNVISLDSYCRTGLSIASYVQPQVISVDRLVAIAINYAMLFLLDDLFFDAPDEFLQEQYGISRGARESPQKIQEYLDHLDAVFSQQVQPSNPTPLIETLMLEAGRVTLELSNPEWFNIYVATVMEFHHITNSSHADIVLGHNLYFQDLESYTVMRDGNAGGKFIQLLLEFGNDTYIPGTLRASPYLEKLTTAASIHVAFVNDIFSYYKESSLEQNPCNLITVLMECEGKPFVQTVHMAIELVNTYARAILDLEAEAWNSTMRNHLQDIKVLIAGAVYFSIMDKRYRHPHSIFPELRDMTSSWKLLPDAEGHVGL